MYGLNERKDHELTSTFPVFKTLVTLGMIHNFYDAPKRLGDGDGFRKQGRPAPGVLSRLHSRAAPALGGREGPGASFMCKQAVPPHSCAEGDLVYRQTVRQGTDCYYNKAFSSSPYLHVESTFPWTTLEAQLSLGADTADHLGPRPCGGSRPLQASQDGCSRPSRGSWLLWGELGLGGPLGLELLDGVECLVESESGCEDRMGRA